MADYLDGKGKFDYHKWIRKNGRSEAQPLTESRNKELVKIENAIFFNFHEIKQLLDAETDANGARADFDKLEKAFFTGLKAITRKHRL